ncbi:MAG TPA: ankyrin repeat domain-containing protein [Steroidobacteraceae bacterium]|nr:ankyrin repeat domain-containing protein [Steroidobacteraceae bacterium]
MAGQHGLIPGGAPACGVAAGGARLRCGVVCAAAVLSLALADGALAQRAGGRGQSLYADPASQSSPAPIQSGSAPRPNGPVLVVHKDSTPPLVEAAQSREPQVALELIARGADVNAAAPDGTTALLWAIHYDEVPLIDRLIAAHANVRGANDYGATPMSEAATFGDRAVIERLVKAGANPDSANADGETALMVLARTDNVEAARFLIRHGADVNARERLTGQTALMWAAARSEPEMVGLLLHYGANPNVRSAYNTERRQITSEPRIQARPTGGFTPLIYAARAGCIACAQALVAGGAITNLTDPDGETPLLIAAENFHFDLAAYLLKQGADPNRWDWWGRTPLYAAVDLDTLPYGGRPDHVSLDATSSLKMIELLLAAGANPNAQLKLFPPYRSLGADRGGDSMLTTGTTPLLRAAKAGDVAAIRVLLAHGAIVGLPNRMGETPLMAAAGLGTTPVDTRGKYKTQQEAVDVIELLVAGGANINAVDERGETALFGAASFGFNDVVRSLVAHHADINVKDNRGMTAIDAAMGRTALFRRGTPEVHPETANLLRQLMIASNINIPPTNPVHRAL